MASACIPIASRGLLAVHDGRVIFAPKPNKKAPVETLLSAANARELGDDGVIIHLDAVKNVVVHHDAEGTTVINGKGSNVIVANIPDEENRQKVVSALTGARSFTRTQKKSGLFATASKSFVFFLISIIFTFGGVMASLSAKGGTVDGGTHSGRRGAQQDAFAAIVTALGTGGTALVGGLFILGSGALLANRLKHHRYTIDYYQ